MDGMINTYNGKQSPVLSIGNDYATVQYFAFKFLASTLMQGAQRGSVQLKSFNNAIPKDVICQAFTNKEKTKTYLHFINRSGKNTTLYLPAAAKNYTLKAIEADVPYATAGKTMYEKNYPNKVTPVRYKEATVKNNQILLPPYAFGYVEY
jgi:hypothetical protein